MSVSHVQQSCLDAGLQCVMLTFDSAEAELLLGGVVDNVLSSILLTFFHILEMKRPLSVDTASPGRLKFLTHPRMNALQQSTVVELTIGTTSRSLVVLHRMVRRYLYPSDSRRGPTTSIYKSENRGFLTGFCFKGVRIGCPVLTSWHRMHVLGHAATSLSRVGQYSRVSLLSSLARGDPG